MDVQDNAGSIVQAIADSETTTAVAEIVDTFKERATMMLDCFIASPPTPSQAHKFENQLHEILGEVGRQLVQWFFSRLELPVDQMPGTLSYREQSHRRLPEKTTRENIVTRFGKITLTRARYRRGRSGRTIFPLEISLGIENGFTPAAADRVAKQFAACGSSQGRTLEMIADQMRAKIGTEKLRRLIGTLANGMKPLREQAQVQKLIGLIDQARQNKEKPMLSVSRDGVALGLAPWSFFEMASVACVSVLADGKKLGTVYLGCVPETNQATLSNQLTSLLKATIRGCGDCVPEIVYVSDAGKIETAYWENTLRKFFVDGRRIKITRVVDYYHAAERLTKIADALKLGGDKAKREEWLGHARWLLLQPDEHGKMLRSIGKMRELHGYKKSGEEDAEKAERYLRRYGRFMKYADMKSGGCPIGSGVVESACRQIVSERMKLSGMRWLKEGGAANDDASLPSAEWNLGCGL